MTRNFFGCSFEHSKTYTEKNWRFQCIDHKWCWCIFMAKIFITDDNQYKSFTVCAVRNFFINCHYITVTSPVVLGYNYIKVIWQHGLNNLISHKLSRLMLYLHKHCPRSDGIRRLLYQRVDTSVLYRFSYHK